MVILRPNVAPTEVWNGFTRGGYATWPPGQECEVHCHQDAGEFFVFLGGQCEITFDNETILVSPGCTVYVGPGEMHKLKAVGDQPLEMFLAVFPNHEPTHTFPQDDGTMVHRNRQRPVDAPSG